MTPFPIPDIIAAFVYMVVLFVVINGLKALSELIGRPLGGYATVVAGAVTIIVLFNISIILQLAVAIGGPDIADKINVVFQIIVLLLGAAGIKREVKLLRPG